MREDDRGRLDGKKDKNEPRCTAGLQLQATDAEKSAR